MNNLPAQKPTGFAELSQQQQQAHRETVGVRAQAILSQFWRDDSTPDAIQAVEIEGWIDVLQSFRQSEIRDAWAIYQMGGPRTAQGKLYKPDAGYLHRIICALRSADVLPSDAVRFCQSLFRDQAKVTPDAGDERQLADGSWEIYHPFSGWGKLHV